MAECPVLARAHVAAPGTKRVNGAGPVAVVASVTRLADAFTSPRMAHLCIIGMTSTQHGAVRSVDFWSMAGSLIAERSFPTLGAGAVSLYWVATPSVLTSASLVAALPVPTIGTLLLALFSLISRFAVADSIDMITDSAIVAVAAPLAVHMVGSRRAGVGTNGTRPSHGAVTLAGHWVALALVLALAGIRAVCSMLSRGTRVLT